MFSFFFIKSLENKVLHFLYLRNMLNAVTDLSKKLLTHNIGVRTKKHHPPL
jgi:hypothetical protein